MTFFVTVLGCLEKSCDDLPRPDVNLHSFLPKVKGGIDINTCFNVLRENIGRIKDKNENHDFLKNTKGLFGVVTGQYANKMNELVRYIKFCYEAYLLANRILCTKL